MVTALAIAASSAAAQTRVTFEGCRDFRGRAVASVLDNSINDIADALVAPNGLPIIRYNTRVLSTVTGPTRLFFYVHECAHHYLGHATQRPSLANERAADRWAVQTLRRKLNMSCAALRAIQRDIAGRGRGDWTHLPGPMRAIDLGAASGCNGSGAGGRVQVPCTHRAHPFDRQHQYDRQHPFDTVHRADRMHPFDTAHRFDRDYYGRTFPCQHKIACSHPRPCQHQIPCSHTVPCRHHVPCAHRAHPFDLVSR